MPRTGVAQLFVALVFGLGGCGAETPLSAENKIDSGAGGGSASGSATPKPDGGAGATGMSGNTGVSGNTGARVLMEPSGRDSPPAFSPELVLLTLVGGVSDQFIRSVGFNADGSITASGKGFVVTADAKGRNVKVQGDVTTADTEGFPSFPSLPGKPGRLYEDARNGLHYRIGYEQIGGNLQRPIFRAFASESATEPLWGFWEASKSRLEEKRLTADSRCYQVWAMPKGHIGIQCWCDGGNSVLETDPKSLDDAKTWTDDQSFQKGAGGTSSLYGLVDPATGTIVSGTFIGTHVAHVITDNWGRVYGSRPANQRQTRVGPDNPFGMPENAGAGFFVLDPSLRKVLLNIRLGGTSETGIQRFAVMAINDQGLLVLGGTSNAPDVPALGEALQQMAGGGQDGLLAIIRLW
ncbi:MAG: hypothetical protein SF187_16960 [Deltaproteobacteria bacterium]|nr:hypothetical protein [Deltaproteobacteria bacterium]